MVADPELVGDWNSESEAESVLPIGPNFESYGEALESSRFRSSSTGTSSMGHGRRGPVRSTAHGSGESERDQLHSGPDIGRNRSVWNL